MLSIITFLSDLTGGSWFVSVTSIDRFLWVANAMGISIDLLSRWSDSTRPSSGVDSGECTLENESIPDNSLGLSTAPNYRLTVAILAIFTTGSTNSKISMVILSVSMFDCTIRALCNLNNRTLETDSFKSSTISFVPLYCFDVPRVSHYKKSQYQIASWARRIIGGNFSSSESNNWLALIKFDRQSLVIFEMNFTNYVQQYFLELFALSEIYPSELKHSLFEFYEFTYVTVH